jgi:hypothetical protein
MCKIILEVHGGKVEGLNVSKLQRGNDTLSRWPRRQPQRTYPGPVHVTWVPSDRTQGDQQRWDHWSPGVSDGKVIQLFYTDSVWELDVYCVVNWPGLLNCFFISF